MSTIGVGTFEATPRMRELVGQVLDTGRISYGPLSQAFEHEFARIHECRYAVLSNSGTSSLHVALQALKERGGWRDGDEVIVPAVTFVATVNVVLHNGLTPVLVDVESDFYAIDPAKIEAAITPRTRCLLPVHPFGQPADMTAICELAGRHGLAVIEDSCECMFAQHAAKMVGSFGDISCFSTYVAHLVTTGVGGLALTSDPALAGIMRSLVNHGRDGIYTQIDDDDGLSGERLRQVMSRRFHFERIGHSFRITELEAALGLAQFEDWPGMIARRRWNAGYLTRQLDPYRAWLQLPALRPDTTHAYMMYPLVLRHESKAVLCEHLERYGIETRETLPLTRQPCYAGLWNPDDYPVADWLNRSGFYVGCHQDLDRTDLERIVRAIGGHFQPRPAAAALPVLVEAAA